MKKIFLLLVVILSASLMAQPPYGSYHLLHTQSAKTFEQGRLEVFTNMNFFTSNVQWLGSGNVPEGFKPHNMWLVAGNFALTYGFSDMFDMTISNRVYQDNHRPNTYNLPGDLFLTAKIGSFNLARRMLFGGLELKSRFPTGEVHNYPYAEYASGAVEFGASGFLSFFSDPYLPERSYNVHLNVGYWNYMEAGKVLYEFSYGKQLIATKNSSAFKYAVGFSYPTAMFDFALEAHGLMYIEQPDSFVYSREDWAYVTPSIKYKPLNWLDVVLGVDIRVTPDKKTTKLLPDPREDIDLPSYAAWKVQLGLNFRILPFAPPKKTAAEIKRDEFHKRVEFFQQIIQERERSEDIQEELERLKQERESAEKELEELRQILEEEGN
ncbi:MAG TPA: hypothetical protein EYP36_01240 [Calditrichaeota bacterium]|nr:hypothetical protein [Calditrichota bacterium]